MNTRLKIDYLLFRARRILWVKKKQAGIIHKRPIFDAGGVYIKPSMGRGF